MPLKRDRTGRDAHTWIRKSPYWLDVPLDPATGMRRSQDAAGGKLFSIDRLVTRLTVQERNRFAGGSPSEGVSGSYLPIGALIDPAARALKTRTLHY